MSSMGEKVKETILLLLKGAADEPQPSRIDEGLYLGSARTADNKKALKGLNITHVLVVARELDPAHPSDFEYKKIDVVDYPTTNIQKHFDECFNFIDLARQGGGSVLVHCFAGISRSATVVIAYLMKKRCIGRLEAMALVRGKRPQVYPNFGFIKQLEVFEMSIRGLEESVENRQ